MYLLTLDVPDDVSREELFPADLPADWQRLSVPQPTAAIGQGWLEAGRTLALRVPSVVVPAEPNFLLNPAHPEFSRVRLAAEPEWFSFDERPARMSLYLAAASRARLAWVSWFCNWNDTCWQSANCCSATVARLWAALS